MAKFIADLQQRRKIEKEYLTVLVGNTRKQTGMLVANVTESFGRFNDTVKYKQNITEDTHNKNNKNNNNNKSHATRYEILTNNGKDCMLCSFRTNTGAKHQIRVH